MAIITEYTNYANTDMPYIKDDSLSYLFCKYPQTRTIRINGKDIEVTTGHDIGLDLGYHISSYKHPKDGVWYLDYAIKSKDNTQTKYIIFYTKCDGNWLNFGVGTSNTLDLNSDLSNTVGLSSSGTTNDSSNYSFAIVEIGEYIGIMHTWDATNYLGQFMGHYANFHYITKKTMRDILGEVDERTYDPEFGGISDIDGYNPNFDNSSDIIPVPTTPSIGVSSVGFVNVYRTTQGALQNLGADIFPDFEEIEDVQPDTSELEMLANGFQYLGKNITTLLKSYINSNLINYIIDCHCLPVTPSVGETEKIKIGFKEFTQSAQRVTSDYVDFDCGTINIKEYYGNFIDYVGTRAQLYLPFVGFVPIKNEYFQSGVLGVKYRFNVIDGSFMCYLISTSSKSNLKETVVATYSGNACVHIPITGVNYSNMLSGVVNGVASVVGGAMTGNVGGAVSGALNTLSCKPEMQSSNSYNSTSAFLGVRYPYLLIEREVSNFSENYPKEYGLPLNVTKQIKELTGFVQMNENVIVEVDCTSEEQQMIFDLLTNGIII